MPFARELTFLQCRHKNDFRPSRKWSGFRGLFSSMFQRLESRFLSTGGREMRSGADRSLMVLAEGNTLQNFACHLLVPLLRSLALPHAPKTNRQEKAKITSQAADTFFLPRFSAVASSIYPLLLRNLFPRLLLSCRKQCSGPNFAESSGKATQGKQEDSLAPGPSILNHLCSPSHLCPSHARPQRGTANSRRL